MVTRMCQAGAVMAGVLFMAAAMPAQGQSKEKIYRNLAPAQIEAALNDMNIKFNRTQPPNLPKDFDFDFDRNNFKIRLTLSDGKRLWISAFFPKATLEKINEWNIKAKFSRAVLDRVGDREYAIVEYQMDAGGGVTDSMIKQFIRRFDNEVNNFDQFLRN